jgi:GDPmannose 4,6-dehydratase
MEPRRALVTGITGQDGAYLAQFLLAKGYEVYGLYRRTSSYNFWRLQALGIDRHVNLISGDMTDGPSLANALETSRPHEVYNLAAQSFVGTSFTQPIGTTQTTGLGVTRLLEAVRAFDLSIRVYQASTSEMFGRSNVSIMDESTPFRPASPYAVAKVYGHWMACTYREAHGLFICNGILFNHESPLRGLEFVTRKVTNAVAKIALGIQQHVTLGGLTSSRDWGYAPEYVEAMWLTLQQEKPDDYVIATGETHLIQELVVHAFEAVDLPWGKHVKFSNEPKCPLDMEFLNGSYQISPFMT